MSTLTIGRVGMDVADYTASAVSLGGGTVQLKGTISASSSTIAEVLVEQLLGYANTPDELFVPVTWTGGPSNLPGFYRVRGASMASQSSVGNLYDFTVDLERVRSYTAPLIESTIIGGDRESSDTGLVTPVAWHAVPSTAKGYELSVLTPTRTTKTVDGGTVAYYTDGTNVLYDATPEWYLSASSWYVGASSLTVADYLVTGRECANEPTDWVLSNGLVKFTANAASAAITSSLYSGGSWGSTGDWQVVRRTAPTTFTALDAPHTLTVLRNDPACVTIRLTHDAASAISGAYFAVYVDVSLRRGSNTAVVTLSTRGSYTWGFYSPLPNSSVTTAYDSSAESGFIACGTSTYSITGTPGRFGTATASQFAQWGWGYLGAFTQQQVAQEYAAAQSEQVQVVAR